MALRFDRSSDQAPRVDVYGTNTFNESGHLVTTMSGRVRQAHRYGR